MTWSEDSRNTWSPGAQHKVRVYPLKNTDGSIEPYAYVIAPEDVPTGVDFQDAVMIVRNVQPVVTAGNGDIEADKPELVYSGVKGTTSADQTVTVSNTGSTPLAISSVTLAGTNPGDFTLAGGAPATLPVGGSATYTVAFKPGASVVGVRSAQLRIASDDADTPTLDIGLNGLSLNGLEGANEPPLADVVRTLGRTINVGWTGPDQRQPRHRHAARGRRGRSPAVHPGEQRPGDPQAGRTVLPERGTSLRLVPAHGWHAGAQQRGHHRQRAVPDAQPGDRDGGASSFDPGARASASTSTRTASTGRATPRTS